MQFQRSKPAFLQRKKYIIITLVVLIAVGAVLPKLLIEFAAGREADRRIALLQSNSDSQQAFLIAASGMIHAAYVRSQTDPRPGLLMRLRPYLTNNILPWPIRVQPGAIDLLEIDGVCDAAARTLSFLLRREGLDAAQFNIVAPHGGHVVVEVRDTDETYMLDPLLGVIPMVDGRILSPLEARDAAAKQLPWYQLLSDTADPSYYRKFEKAVFARQGGSLTIKATVRLEPGTELILGSIDGDDIDVVRAGNTESLSPYWHYMGSRYDRSWRRQILFEQDTLVTIVLTDDLNPRFLNISPAPEINGRTLTVRVGAGQTLDMIDGSARRDYLLFRSYQDVDQIRFAAIR